MVEILLAPVAFRRVALEIVDQQGFELPPADGENAVSIVLDRPLQAKTPVEDSDKRGSSKKIIEKIRPPKALFEAYLRPAGTATGSLSQPTTPQRRLRVRNLGVFCLRVWWHRLERYQSRSPVAIMLNLRADALVSASLQGIRLRSIDNGA